MRTSFRTSHDDEQMTHYEWSGAGTGMAHTLPVGTKRDHPWHASYGILALLTTLLILNGCDRQGPAEQTGTQIDEAAQGMKDAPAEPAPAQQAGEMPDDARATAGEKPEPVGEDLQKP